MWKCDCYLLPPPAQAGPCGLTWLSLLWGVSGAWIRQEIKVVVGWQVRCMKTLSQRDLEPDLSSLLTSTPAQGSVGGEIVERLCNLLIKRAWVQLMHLWQLTSQGLSFFVSERGIKIHTSQYFCKDEMEWFMQKHFKNFKGTWHARHWPKLTLERKSAKWVKGWKPGKEPTLSRWQ